VSRPSRPAPLPAALARAAVDSLGDAVVLCGTAGEVLHLNPAAEELFQRSGGLAVGAPLRALPGGLALSRLAERVLATQESAQADLPHPQDAAARVRAHAAPLLDGSTCEGTVLTLHAPQAGERALDFEALAAGLAHEIRNPLAGLQGSAELLAREATGPAGDYARVIAREARRVEGLVRELLDLARPAALQLAPVNVHGAVGDVLLLARGLPGGERVAFSERYDPSLPPVRADREKLTQVILNLARNALDAAATRPDGEITFETGMADLRLRGPGGRTRLLARLSVIDNGPGVPAEMLPRLFTPFATSKSSGTGLGLAISRRIVEAHGGRIEVKNRVGGGAEAAVYLPLEVA